MIWSSSFNYRLILIPKSISFTSDLMQEPWITIAEGSFQLKLRRLSLLLAFIKLLLSHLKSSSDDFCNTLTSLLTTLNICFLNNLYFILGSYDNWNWFIMYTGNKNYVKKRNLTSIFFISAIWLHHGNVEPLSGDQSVSVKTERATYFLQKTHNE